MSEPKSDLERRAEMYRAALENIQNIASEADDEEEFQTILEIASDALAEDIQEHAKPDPQLSTDLHFAEL